MGVLHVLNCVALCFGPHLVYYQATQLSEYDTWRSIVHGLVCQVASLVIKTFLLATFATAGDSLLLLGVKELVYILVCIVDIIWMWVALNKNPNKHISTEHKFQGVGLGWALGDSICRRLFPIVLGARSPEFTTAYLLQSLESNFFLILAISFAAAASLLWGKRAKTSPLLFLLRANMLYHALVPGILSLLHHYETVPKSTLAAVSLASSLVGASLTFVLYQGMTRPVKAD